MTPCMNASRCFLGTSDSTLVFSVHLFIISGAGKVFDLDHIPDVTHDITVDSTNVLGSGGNGTVYAGYVKEGSALWAAMQRDGQDYDNDDLVDRNIVAVKTVNPRSDCSSSWLSCELFGETGLQHYFRNNARFVQVHGVIMNPSRTQVTGMVMENCNWGSMKNMMKAIQITKDNRGLKRLRFTGSQVDSAALLVEIARGLHTLHIHKLAHLDLKTCNVMLATDKYDSKRTQVKVSRTRDTTLFYCNHATVVTLIERAHAAKPTF